MTTPGGYDFGALYGMADHSTGFLYDAGSYDAVVESAEFGRTKDGTKGAWTIKFRTTTGANAGRSPLTTTLSISPKKNDGSDNAAGLGIMFRQLAALGIPVPDPENPQLVLNGQAPFWVMGWTEDMVAQAMIGKPALITVQQDEYEGVTRNKVRGIRPPRPGAPLDWPRTQQPPQQQAFGTPPGYGPPQQPPAQYAPQGYGYQQAPAAQPWQQPAPQSGPPPQWQQPQPPMQQAGPAQYAAPQVPGVPPWAQPATPGQGGLAEFTTQGQSTQPAYGYGPQQPPQAPPVPQPPWAQQQPQQASPGYNGYQQPQQPAQPAPGQPEAPPAPPWAQQ